MDHRFVAQLNSSSRIEFSEPVNCQRSKLEAPDIDMFKHFEHHHDTALRELYKYYESNICMNESNSAKALISKAESNAIADFIMSESSALAPFVFCKYHDRISKNCANTCDACKVLNSNTDCIRDCLLYTSPSPRD